MPKEFQSYRGTWAWLTQRVSAVGLFLLIPVKIYSGWAGAGRVPFPAFLGGGLRVHMNNGLDMAILLFFLLHGFYGVRVILIEFGVIAENRYFWRTLALVLALFGAAVWFVYIKGPKATY
jgi:succinate dehydrogenase hydrophobic anchor subunit